MSSQEVDAMLHELADAVRHSESVPGADSALPAQGAAGSGSGEATEKASQLVVFDPEAELTFDEGVDHARMHVLAVLTQPSVLAVLTQAVLTHADAAIPPTNASVPTG